MGRDDAERDKQEAADDAEKPSTKALGWLACLLLSGSLIYAFVRSAKEGAHEVDPWFFGAQTLASTLFLLYSLRLKNRVFVTANAVAILSAAGTLLLKLF
jgi:lipid-A-disaccharide synthase-like uncharacterized protein